MIEDFEKFVTALRGALTAQRFESEAAVAVGSDPDDGGPWVELHVFDVPPAIRRDVETRAIDILLDVEDAVPGVASIAFVYTPALDASARAAIMTRAEVRHAPAAWLRQFLLWAALDRNDPTWASLATRLAPADPSFRVDLGNSAIFWNFAPAEWTGHRVTFNFDALWVESTSFRRVRYTSDPALTADEVRKFLAERTGVPAGKAMMLGTISGIAA